MHETAIKFNNSDFQSLKSLKIHVFKIDFQNLQLDQLINLKLEIRIV